MAAQRKWWETPPPSPPPADGSAPALDFKPLDMRLVPDSGDNLLTRRVHLLGTGSIGTLVAHSLAILPNPPPITLMLHRPELWEDFKAGGRIVRLVNKATEVNDEQMGFDVDVLESSSSERYEWKHISASTRPHLDQPSSTQNPRTAIHPPSAEEMTLTGEVFIYTLIVTVKGPATVQALQSVKHRIDSQTTVLLMQNGMGQIEELNEKVFTDPERRPTYMLGIISHGCYMAGPFAVNHAGFGTVALGVWRDPEKYPMPPKDEPRHLPDIPEDERRKLYPTEEDLYSNLSSRYLLRTLTRSTVLACAAYPYLDLFQLQLEKLVTNCIINPITAILDFPNGSLLNNQPLTRVQRLLIAEIAVVIRSLPELEGIPNVRTRFSPSRLEQIVRNMTDKTANNSSSMREDMRKVARPEIDYINGYIVKRGEEQGIRAVMNYMIMQLVKGKIEYMLGQGVNFMPKDKSEQTSTRDGDSVVLEDLQGREGASQPEGEEEYRPMGEAKNS